MLRRLLGAFAAALVLPAPAVAQIVGEEHAASPAGHLAFVTKGETSESTLRVVSPDGAVGAAEPITGDDETPTVAVGTRGDAIVAWADREHRLWARYRPAGGQLGPQDLVAPNASDLVEALPLALDATGAAMIAWAPENGHGGLHVRVRDPSAGWAPPQALGGTDVYRPSLALADNGSAVIAFNQRGPKRGNTEQVAVAGRAPGQPFGPPQVVAGVQRNAQSVHAATNDRGDAIVVWIETPRRRRGADVVFTVDGVIRPAGGSFGRPIELSRGTDATGPSVAVQASGRMIVAWRDNDRHLVEARVRSSTGVLGRPQRLTRRLDLNSGPIALGAGRGAVAWTDSVRPQQVIRVAQATDDRRFGAAQVIARGRPSDIDPAIGVSPAGLSVVARPPFDPGDPIGWQRVVLR